MSDNKVTLDQLDSSAVEAMSSSVGDVSMLNTENKTIVGALAEIVGKKEIANAIGEPLAETDKFTEMSSEINGLLSTFKTNMMNAGVVVESGDKFKALIDKIKGLTEGEGSKGIQFAEGQAEFDADRTLSSDNCYVYYNLDFTPTYLFVRFDAIFNANQTANSFVLSNLAETIINTSDFYFQMSLFDITNASCLIADHIGTNECTVLADTVYYYAIGVGEEDTTLRDSLASILENKGVDVTEEDDMASLITKVDNMTSNMVKYKSGIHEHIFDGTTGISFEVTGIGFRPTFVQICRVNKTGTDDGCVFWINNAYMSDSNSIYIPVPSISDLKSTSYTGLNAGVKYNEIVVNDDGFSLSIITGGTSGDLWHFEWFVLG